MSATRNPQREKVSKKHAVFCGRFSPLHRGHEAVIALMLKEWGLESSVIVIGSANAPLSPRNVFSLHERKALVQHLYPSMKIVSALDYESDDQWLSELDSALHAAGVDRFDSMYFAGSRDDASYFLRADRPVTIVDRYDGTTPIVSGTDVRDALFSGRSISHLVNPVIEPDIRALFVKNTSL